MKVYQFDSYLDFLFARIRQNEGTRGYQALLAKAGGMHPSYLSRILNHSTHLTPDQAAGLTDFWKLDHDETAYFMNLVHFDRAGNPKLRKFIERELEAIRKRHQELGEHLSAEKMSAKDEGLYYSAWFYSAAHVLLTIPAYRHEKGISEKLGLPLEQTRVILETLMKLGLARTHRGNWEPTKANIHLSNDSWIAGGHHINWRMKAADRIQLRKTDDLHYTGIHSLSAADFKKVRETLQDSLLGIDRIVRPSKEEELVCLTVDWFKM